MSLQSGGNSAEQTHENLCARKDKNIIELYLARKEEKEFALCFCLCTVTCDTVRNRKLENTEDEKSFLYISV